MAGIFRKFAIMNNVSTVISTVNGGHLYQSGPSKYDPLDPSKIKILGYGLPGAHYELVANHMTWNKNFIDKNLPSDAKKITILRNPATLFESSWKYYYTVFNQKVLGAERLKLTDSVGQVQQLNRLIENANQFYENALKMRRDQYRHILRTQLASFGYKDVFMHDLDRLAPSKNLYRNFEEEDHLRHFNKQIQGPNSKVDT